MVCSRCGKCCREFSVPGVTYYNYRKFLKKYPFLVHVGPRWGIDAKMVPSFDCTHLLEDGDRFKCADYANRPNFCREFPEILSFRPENCTAEPTKEKVLVLQPQV